MVIGKQKKSSEVVFILEVELELGNEQKSIKLKSLKGRDAQKLWNLLKSFDKLSEEDTDKAIEASEKLQTELNKLIVIYSELEDKDLEELTVDDKTKLTDYLIEQAQKHVIGFSIPSQKQVN